MQLSIPCLSALGLCAAQGFCTAAQAATATPPHSAPVGAAPLQTPERHLVQHRECSRRIGPFATQDSAWRQVRQARRQGYSTSGVFPCHGSGGGRGYCFNVFGPC